MGPGDDDSDIEDGFCKQIGDGGAAYMLDRDDGHGRQNALKRYLYLGKFTGPGWVVWLKADRLRH